MRKNKNVSLSDSHEEVCEKLKEHIFEGKHWAFQIYFKYMASQRTTDKLITISQSNGEDRETAIKNALVGFNQLTHAQMLEELKMHKKTESELKYLGDNTDIADNLEADKIKLIDSWLKAHKAL